MENRKEKSDLEQLLNSLIEKGWKPFGEGCHRSLYKRVDVHKNYNKERTYALFYSNNHTHWKVLRQLVSKESGLWQFVCENDMVDKKKIGIFYEMFLEENGIDAKNYRPFSLVERLIIESALCDEDKLEDFLLNNINADE